MKRIAVLGTALLAGGILWLGRPAGGHSAQALVEGLNGPDAVNCFAELRQLEDEQTDAAIIAGTKHTSARVRGQCARLLGQRQDVTMAARLAPMLSDPEPIVRNQAARSLLPLLDDEETVELLRSTKLDPGSQLVMVGALLRDPVAITNKPLLDWLLDASHNSEVRVGCYVALRRYRCPEFGQKQSEKEQLPAVLAARRRIIQQVHDEARDASCEEAVRCAALPLYAALTGSTAYEEMLTFMQAPQPALREASLLALAETRDPRAWPLFCKLAGDTRQAPGFRVEALKGLRHMARAPGKKKEVFPLFCRVAQNTNEPPVIRAAALSSLRAYRFDAEALRIARESLTEQEPLVREKAAQCLSELGDKNASKDSPVWLEPSLELVKVALARETDPGAKCAMQSAICSLEGRLASRGK
ncbi:MAG: hypothetical protein KF760_32210 [Candidatus Eremiobacteraeota bacterium]|nr:hypothetical protein [Candidatus Eremiobacteraeota bacterium]MCW5871394.1 hypothetical protein [Candidatus Eremiobacteraeota bacterium]